jgi:toxin-antitoxin system PIN domain toxin
MRALLDVNALIALLDEEHVHHAEIHAWLNDPANLQHGFATCAITQLGLIRIMSSKGYFKAVEAQEAAAHLEAITAKGHRYLGIPAPCSGSVHWKPTRSAQATDAVLLAAAVAHGCRLVTFDAGIALASVAEAKREHLVVLKPRATS